MIFDIWHYKIQSLEGTFTFNNFFHGICYRDVLDVLCSILVVDFKHVINYSMFLTIFLYLFVI